MRASLRHRGSFVLPALIALFLAVCGGPSTALAAAGPKAHAASAKTHKKPAKKHKTKAAKKHKKHKAAKKHKTKRVKKRKKAAAAGTSAGTLSATAAAGTRDEQAR